MQHGTLFKVTTETTKHTEKWKFQLCLKPFFLLNPYFSWDYFSDCLSLQPVSTFCDLIWANSAHTAMQRGEVERVFVRVGSPALHLCNRNDENQRNIFTGIFFQTVKAMISLCHRTKHHLNQGFLAKYHWFQQHILLPSHLLSAIFIWESAVVMKHTF